ncbi:MAG: LysR family transcriptional regulator [Pseudomonadales bacterium]|nr:LysR family transcriptional regulator [Pseudomonadales bacterium]
MSSLDIQALTAFIAVADTGSFSAAADRLFLTQPAVSKRIALLESQLNTQVFDRIRKKVFLTEAGRALLPRAHAILQSLKDAQQAVSDVGGDISGKLAIAFSHHIGLHRLPPYLKRYSNEQPKVNLDINFVDSEDGYTKVLDGTSELAVITLSPEPRADIIATPLWHDPLVFVCSPEHPLHLRDNVSLEELSTMDAIHPGENTYTGKIVNQLFERQGVALDTSMTTNYLETIKMMVSIGLGWSVLPKTMIGSLEQIHIPDVYIERQLGIIEYRGRQKSNAANAFKSLLLENAA